eukprot:TRINITY_DN32543_c0_g1_i1.p1 TRINITY_DN32543_c0_g1~~TRINITY_DN32543_c0_g1_i1.p1  ORF type:complete len:167 (+),score=22.72 TRINITY_DN32543_c0_g1_i1:594-1094(+)
MPRGTAAAGRALRETLSDRSHFDRSPSPSRSWSDEEKGPRSFPWHVKKACWEKAETVPGRDPARWRRDVAGNIVFRHLHGCEGCLCYEYDHIVPYSKGGKSVLENCQILQTTTNRAKSNKTDITRTSLQESSLYCVLKKKDMDFLEYSSYGSIAKREEDFGTCSIL